MKFNQHLLQRRTSVCLSLTFILLSYIQLAAQDNAFDYRVHYSSSARTITAQQGITTRDNGTFLVGKWGWSEDSSDVLVMKTDRLGRVIFKKQLPINRRIDNYLLVETADGGVVFAGNSNYGKAPYYSGTYLIKFGCAGQVIWSKIFSNSTLSPAATNETAFHMKAGLNNDIILSTFGQGSATNGRFPSVSRIDGSGNVVWTKTFLTAVEQSTLYPMVSFLSGDKIVAFIFKHNYPLPYPYQRYIVAMQLNYNTGELEKTQGYLHIETWTGSLRYARAREHFYGEQLNTGQFCLYGAFLYQDANRPFYKLIVNPDLSISSATKWGFPSSSFYVATSFNVFPNGQFHMSGMSEDDKTVSYFAGGPDNKVLRSVSRVKDTGTDDYTFTSFQKGEQGFTFLSNKYYLPFMHVEVLSSEQNIEKSGCQEGTAASLSTFYPNWTHYPFSSANWAGSRYGDMISSPFSIQTFDIPMGVNFLCAGTPFSGTMSPQLACDLVLPVKITSFTATSETAAILVKWKTQEQQDVKQYELQSSIDGRNFNEIYTKKVTGQHGSFDYSFPDAKKYNGTQVFYRLITTNLAGNETISDIIRVSIMDAIDKINIYPSPAGETVRIQTAMNIDRLEFYNLAGVKVKQLKQDVAGQPIHVGDLKSGMYLVKAWSGNDIFTLKFVKK